MAEAVKKKGRPKKDAPKEPVTPNETIDMRGKEYEPLEVVTGEIEDLEPDVIQVRKYDLSPKYTIVTRDPHGYSYIEGPNIPHKISGAYTSFMQARSALDDWLREKK
jgi:hypothetical protein